MGQKPRRLWILAAKRPQPIDAIGIRSKNSLDKKNAWVLNVVVVCLTPLHFEEGVSVVNSLSGGE